MDIPFQIQPAFLFSTISAIKADFSYWNIKFGSWLSAVAGQYTESRLKGLKE